MELEPAKASVDTKTHCFSLSSKQLPRKTLQIIWEAIWCDFWDNVLSGQWGCLPIPGFIERDLESIQSIPQGTSSVCHYVTQQVAAPWAPISSSLKYELG